MSFEAAYGSEEREQYRIAHLEDENDRLKAENQKLRAALEAAPEHAFRHPEEVLAFYREWYDKVRAEALKG